MDLKVGDRVKFISDTRSGVVKNISGKLAYVDVDGFEIPVQLSELVPIDMEEEKRAFRIMGGEQHDEIRGFRGAKQKKRSAQTPQYNAPQYGKILFEDEWEDEPIDLPKRHSVDNAAITEYYNRMSTSSTQEEPQQLPFTLSDCRVKLMFVPTEHGKSPETSNLDMYLVNDSSYNIYYSIAKWQGQDYVEVLSNGEMEADSKIKIVSVERRLLNEIVQLQISVLPFKKDKFIPVDGASGKLELHPLKFVKAKNYVENDYFDEHSIEYSLIDNVK